MKGYKDPCSGNRDFSITTSSGPVLPVEFGGTSQVEFCEVDIFCHDRVYSRFFVV